MLVSIIITNFNYEKYIHRCIRSCLVQSLDQNLYEIIVVDDNSTDDSRNILKSYERFKNIKIIKNNKNLGVAASANKAIKNSKGKYFVRLDSDDYINEKMLEFMSTYLLSNHNLLGVACDYFYINRKENKTYRLSAKEKPIACGIMYDKKLFVKYGMYNPLFRHREEEELRSRLKDKYQIDYLKIPFYRYRMHQTNKTKMSDYSYKYKDKIERLKNKYKKINDINIAIIIPARGGSKRFKNKNIFKIGSNSMINIVINEAKKIKFKKIIFVSTEDKKIKNVVKKNNIKVIDRPNKLAKDNVNKIDVIRHAALQIKKKYGNKFNFIMSLQPNSPTIKSYQISECVNKIITKKLDEVMSIDDNLLQNAAIRIFKFNKIFSNNLGTNCGFVITNTLDVHYKKDLKNIKLI